MLSKLGYICATISTAVFGPPFVLARLGNLNHRAIQTQVEGRPKILCLHGGGGAPGAFSTNQGMQDLERFLPQYEFIYAQGGYQVGEENFLWIPDPPSKDNPTTTPTVADASLENLDRIVEEQGPFFGILGYSQGAAFVPVYLAYASPGTFQMAMIFCGYRTETHLGLLNLVDTQSPFGNIPSLIWIGENDNIIANSFSLDLVPKFTSPTVVSDPTGGHFIPRTVESTFNEVVMFVQSIGNENDIVPVDIMPIFGPEPNNEKPVGDKPSYDKPDEKPVDVKPDWEKPDYDKPNKKPVGDKPDWEKPDYDKPNEKPVSNKPGNNKPDEKPVVNKPDDWEKPDIDKPNEKPVVDKPNWEKPVEDKPNENKPNPEFICEDFSSSFFVKQNKSKNCKWVQKKKEKKRSKLCNKKTRPKKNLIKDLCPVACGVCS